MTTQVNQDDPKAVRWVGAWTASVMAVMAFAALVLIMAVNEFAPIAFIPAVVGLCLAPVFGYRFADAAVHRGLVWVTVAGTLGAVSVAGIASGLIVAAWFAAAGSLDMGPVWVAPLAAVMVTLTGLLSIGPFAALLTAPFVTVWAMVVRGITRHRVSSRPRGQHT